MIGNHPSVSQVHVFLKLDGYHFGICLYHDPFQPTPNAFVFIVVVVTKHFYHIPNLKNFFLIGHARKT